MIAASHNPEPCHVQVVLPGMAARAVAAAEVAAAVAGESGAVVVVDGRTDGAGALAVVGRVAGCGAAVLVLAGREQAPAFHAAGATHFLGDPRDDGEIADAIRFAARWSQRAGGGAWREAAADAVPASEWIDDHAASHAILVALSRFDIVNAAHGRAAGDALLAVAERRIRSAAERFARVHVVRWSGATFLVAVAAQGSEGLGDMLARLGEALARPFPAGDAMAVLGARFGVAAREPGDDAAALLRRAGDALAQVRSSDGATVRIAEPDGAAPIATLAIDLHHAIERDEIALLFQPQVRIADDVITGVEALARWDHPMLGSLGAEPLFAAADRADLGLALSDHIQRLALAQVAGWPDRLSHLGVSINLSAADIARAGFAAAFLARVARSGVAPARLTVEITETALIADLDAAAASLAQLRAAGVRVAIDDFGTGYSSFAYLKALPLDHLKIDRSLAEDIVGSARGRAVVRGIVAMADALGLAVVAEGVETEAERDLLAREHCGWYQGFLCAGPIDGAALVRLVEAWPCGDR